MNFKRTIERVSIDLLEKPEALHQTTDPAQHAANSGM